MRAPSGPEDLARFGGPPLFARPRHVNRPNAAPRAAFDAYLDRAWDARWFTNDGPLLAEFETRLAAWLGVRNCVATCNGTAALEIVLRALRLEGEVILPAYTFVSTANALRLAGLTPVFCEADPETMTVDPADCAARITPRTAAVIATHVWGRPCDTDALQELCDKAGAVLLFDAAHAFGVEHRGRRIGGFGRAEIFSLHATKALHAFEGGMVATGDDALAAELRLRRNFGFSGLDRIDLADTNAKMSEVHAAMGLANLDVFGGTVAANRRTHDAYAEGLAGIAGIRLHRPAPDTVSNWHYVVTDIDAGILGLTRDALVGLLAAENVLARRYFHPGGHRMTPHRTDPPQSLPVTEALCDRVLVLPAGAAIAPGDVAAICARIRLIADHAGAIAERLAGAAAGPAPSA